MVKGGVTAGPCGIARSHEQMLRVRARSEFCGPKHPTEFHIRVPVAALEEVGEPHTAKVVYYTHPTALCPDGDELFPQRHPGKWDTRIDQKVARRVSQGIQSDDDLDAVPQSGELHVPIQDLEGEISRTPGDDRNGVVLGHNRQVLREGVRVEARAVPPAELSSEGEDEENIKTII